MSEPPTPMSLPSFSRADCISVLLVEDDLEYVEQLRTASSRRSGGAIRISHRGDLAGAMKALGEEIFDVILLDLDLPDSTGLDTAVILLQQALETPIVVIAASDDDSVAREMSEYGVRNVLPRDRFMPEILLPVLNHAIVQHAMQLSLERHIRELELTNDRFLSLVADNADAIVVVDRIGVVRYINPSAEILLHRSASDLLGQTFGVPLGGVKGAEIDILHGAGGRKTAEIRVMRTLWDGERAYIATMRDITERKKAERALRIAKQSAERANAMKSRFLANISHELRTPLNSIIGFSEMIRSGAHGTIVPAKYREYIDDIHGCGRHLLSLIDDLLDLSKAENDVLTIFEEKFDLAALALSVVEIMAPQAVDRGIRLSVQSFERSPWIKADERMVRQVLLNLVSNAIKFTPEEGRVTVEVNRTACDELRLVVRDTGIGIPSDQIPRAFVAFVQLENTCGRTRAQGAGLGLALTKRFVELHQGHIRLESKEQVGTVVTVTFPAERAVGGAAEQDDVINPAAAGSSRG